VVLPLAVALLVATEVADSGAKTETRKGGTLRLASLDDVVVDTALAYVPTSSPVGFATCAKLFNNPDAPDAAGVKVIPEVVSTYAVSRDGRTYTFELKQTFRFHTGAPVTAQSFAAAFNRDAQPKLESPARGFMREIVGAQAVIDGKATEITGVRVLGRYRLQIRLTRPVGDFTTRLTMGFFCPIPPGTPSGPLLDGAPGSGPYYVAERVPNQRIVLRRNPYYRGTRPANVDQVVWTIGDSPEACLLAVEQDRIDHCVNTAIGIPPTAYRGLAEKYGINRPDGQLFKSPGLGTWYYAFNHDRPAFKGPGQIPLEKAINYAIDRTALTRPAGYLAGERTDQVLPPALARPESIYPLGGPNLAAARRWYARASYKPTTLVLYTSNLPVSVAQAASLKFDLRKLGIDLEVKFFDHAAMAEKAGTRGEPFDLVRQGWVADYADGGNFLQPLLYGRNLGPMGSTDNLNVSYFDDPATNARIEAAQRLTGEARRKAWADLDADLMRTNPPWAPIFHQNNRSFVSKSFGCFLFHPLYGIDIAAACKK
jgi:ABC-type oligopeptide transport system substrate-binding subunit